MGLGPVAFIGDIHGDFFALKNLLAKIPPKVPVIQVGDLGIWNRLRPRWDKAAIDRSIYFVDGNHDCIPLLDTAAALPHYIWPNAIYMPRGHVASVAGFKILFLGGSKSVDRQRREEGDMDVHGWFEAEQLTEADVERAIQNVELANGIDILVTHTPPASVIATDFDKDGLTWFGVDPATWVDESAERVERVWQDLGKPTLFCGHMHQAIIHHRCRILTINEVVIYDKPW